MKKSPEKIELFQSQFFFLLFFSKKATTDQLVTHKKAGYSNTQSRKKIADKRNDFVGNFWWKIAILFPSRELFSKLTMSFVQAQRNHCWLMLRSVHFLHKNSLDYIDLLNRVDINRTFEHVFYCIFLHSFLSSHSSSLSFFLSSSVRRFTANHIWMALIHLYSRHSTCLLSSSLLSAINPVFSSLFIDSTKVCCVSLWSILGMYIHKKKQTKEK